MTIEYRKAEYGDFDIDAVVRIAHAIRPDAYESVADHIEWHEAQRNAGHFCDRWLVSADGHVVGSATVGQSSVYKLPPEIITLYVAIHPGHQNRGYGRALQERAEATAVDRNALKAYSYTDETQPRSIRFLERSGYGEVDRGWESSLDLTQCDPSDFRDAVARIASSGVRIASANTFALERDDWQRDLHQLYASLERDVPGPFPTQTVSLANFEAQNLGRRFLGEGFLVALDDGQLVGLSELQQVDDVPGEISQRLTGVHPDYRGHGVASALKSQAVIWATEAGYTSMRTHNSQSNSSMLAINNRLGFRRSHATMVYLKEL